MYFLSQGDSFVRKVQQPSSLFMSNSEHHPAFVVLMLKLLEEQALSMISQ
jgi:hypothetical protein